MLRVHKVRNMTCQSCRRHECCCCRRRDFVRIKVYVTSFTLLRILLILVARTEDLILFDLVQAIKTATHERHAHIQEQQRLQSQLSHESGKSPNLLEKELLQHRLQIHQHDKILKQKIVENNNSIHVFSPFVLSSDWTTIHTMDPNQQLQQPNHYTLQHLHHDTYSKESDKDKEDTVFWERFLQTGQDFFSLQQNNPNSISPVSTDVPSVAPASPTSCNIAVDIVCTTDNNQYQCNDRNIPYPRGSCDSKNLDVIQFQFVPASCRRSRNGQVGTILSLLLSNNFNNTDNAVTVPTASTCIDSNPVINKHTPTEKPLRLECVNFFQKKQRKMVVSSGRDNSASLRSNDIVTITSPNGWHLPKIMQCTIYDTTVTSRCPENPGENWVKLQVITLDTEQLKLNEHFGSLRIISCNNHLNCYKNMKYKYNIWNTGTTILDISNAVRVYSNRNINDVEQTDDDNIDTDTMENKEESKVSALDMLLEEKRPSPLFSSSGTSTAFFDTVDVNQNLNSNQDLLQANEKNFIELLPGSNKMIFEENILINTCLPGQHTTQVVVEGIPPNKSNDRSTWCEATTSYQVNIVPDCVVDLDLSCTVLTSTSKTRNSYNTIGNDHTNQDSPQSCFHFLNNEFVQPQCICNVDVGGGSTCARTMVFRYTSSKCPSASNNGTAINNNLLSCTDTFGGPIPVVHVTFTDSDGQSSRTLFEGMTSTGMDIVLEVGNGVCLGDTVTITVRYPDSRSSGITEDNLLTSSSNRAIITSAVLQEVVVRTSSCSSETASPIVLLDSFGAFDFVGYTCNSVVYEKNDGSKSTFTNNNNHNNRNNNCFVDFMYDVVLEQKSNFNRIITLTDLQLDFNDHDGNGSEQNSVTNILETDEFKALRNQDESPSSSSSSLSTLFGPGVKVRYSEVRTVNRCTSNGYVSVITAKASGRSRGKIQGLQEEDDVGMDNLTCDDVQVLSWNIRSLPTFDRPTNAPTSAPITLEPSNEPTTAPSNQPTTQQPTLSPTTDKPSAEPTKEPTTQKPTSKPTHKPTRTPTTSKPTGTPTTWKPTREPTKRPTHHPTQKPTNKPTKRPTKRPTRKPTKRPTTNPSDNPTDNPTDQPSSNPSAIPITKPTKRPTKKPTNRPTKKPTYRPTIKPSNRPTEEPTSHPRKEPTSRPTKKPTSSPTKKPTNRPTKKPTNRPTKEPTTRPTKKPTNRPTKKPTTQPMKRPTNNPTNQPISSPTSRPTRKPSVDPTVTPTSSTPKSLPTNQPMLKPTSKPTRTPIFKPTKSPTDKPTRVPTLVPISNTRRPTVNEKGIVEIESDTPSSSNDYDTISPIILVDSSSPPSSTFDSSGSSSSSHPMSPFSPTMVVEISLPSTEPSITVLPSSTANNMTSSQAPTFGDVSNTNSNSNISMTCGLDITVLCTLTNGTLSGQPCDTKFESITTSTVTGTNPDSSSNDDTLLTSARFEIDVFVPASNSSEGSNKSILFLTGLTASTNFAGDIDLTELIDNFTVQAGHVSISIPATIDSTTQRTYTILISANGTKFSQGSNDDDNLDNGIDHMCTSKSFHRFFVGRTVSPGLPTVMPSLSPSVSYGPSPDPLIASCDISSDISCSFQNSTGEYIDCKDNVRLPHSPKCYDLNYNVLELTFLYSGLSCEASNTTGRDFRCQNENGGITLDSPSPVYITVTSRNYTEIYYSSIVSFGEQFTVQQPVSATLSTSSLSSLFDKILVITISRVSIEQTAGETLQLLKIRTTCNDPDDISLLTQYGSLQLTGYRSARQGYQSAFTRLIFDFAVTNVGEVTALVDRVSINSTLLGERDVMESGTSVEFIRGQREVFRFMLPINLYQAFGLTFFNAIAVTGTALQNPTNGTCQHEANLNVTINA